MSVHAYQDHDEGNYDAAVRQTLRDVGEFAAELGDDALLIITSDHGEEFGEHGGVVHGLTLFDEVARVPLLIRWPGQAPVRIDALTSSLQIFPTLLAAMHPGPRGTGESGPFLCLRPPCQDANAAMALERPAAHLHGLRVGSEVAIYDPGNRLMRSYDLERDPGQQSPLDVATRAQRRLEELEAGAFGPQTLTDVWPFVAPPGMHGPSD